MKISMVRPDTLGLMAVFVMGLGLPINKPIKNAVNPGTITVQEN